MDSKETKGSQPPNMIKTGAVEWGLWLNQCLSEGYSQLVGDSEFRCSQTRPLSGESISLDGRHNATDIASSRFLSFGKLSTFRFPVLTLGQNGPTPARIPPVVFLVGILGRTKSWKIRSLVEVLAAVVEVVALADVAVVVVVEVVVGLADEVVVDARENERLREIVRAKHINLRDFKFWIHLMKHPNWIQW